jgi:hypothetical protein
VANPALAGTGATSKFLNPIPQTRQANGNVADFGSSSTDSYLSRADSGDEFAVASFTLEAIFNRSNSVLASVRYIAAQFNGAGNQRSWAFGMWANTGDNPSQLFAILSQAGTTGVTVFSGFPITPGVDYYAAITFNSDTGAVTFYLQDLTNGGLLQSRTVASGLPGLKNSTADFQIGTLGGSSLAKWVGSIDEVRLSNAVLSQSELLAVLPGPASARR